MPRKKSESFYRKNGFTANYSNGKYSATCHHCNKVLQNTALSRLSLHRQTCDSRRSRCPVVYHKVEKKDPDDIGPRIKIQKISGADDDGGLDNPNEGKEIIVKIQQILDEVNGGEASKEPPIIKTEFRKSRNSKNNEAGAQNVEFEISNSEEPNAVYVEYLDESKEHSAEDSGNAATIVEARPRNNLLALKAEKVRAEIKQFQSKTTFLKTETENLKLERTLTLLRIQKLRLEIEALRA
ncbi:uncharacterized protein LOC108112868 isoform X2 [Drosophila eugracilis]|uniref:uncharacterized protein LOC108112868 isoform X2 n=1 Tax=Drosophila eugracilis TaxID=29029 RepID=UPI0007E78797|nr:uncharacterized protein LOC108112868 isoform X2 [Drosophila eugracilis]